MARTATGLPAQKRLASELGMRVLVTPVERWTDGCRVIWVVVKAPDNIWKRYPHPAYCLTKHENAEGAYTTNCLAVNRLTSDGTYNDAYNNLVRRRLDADGAGTGGFTEKFWICDGDEAILEFASGTATAPSHRYLWGPAVDQILADEQVATGSPSDVRWTGGRLAGHRPRRRDV